MNYLYLIIELSAFIIPFVFSFDKRLRFYKHAKSLFVSTLVVALLFISFDIYFTSTGVWGFNSSFHSSLTILKLPIEEWLFFIAIPYASIFTHYCLVSYLPAFCLSDKVARAITFTLLLFFCFLIFMVYSKAYTLYILLLLIATLLISLFDKAKLINRFYLTFLVIMIPFALVNGFLTGSFFDNVIVWYNNNEILGIRLLTFPVEDIGYAFSLIFLNILLLHRLQRLSFFKIDKFNDRKV